MSRARELIAELALQPHPEGGWYRETWRAPIADGKRAAATAIYFLLEAGQKSHWHKVDAAEIWLWHLGDPLELRLAERDDEPVRTVMIGPDISAGQQVQHVVAPYEWQAARPVGGNAGYTLVSCVVAPAFDFEGFTLAPGDWAPGGDRKTE